MLSAIVSLCTPPIIGALILGLMVAVALGGDSNVGDAIRAASERVGGIEVFAFAASAYGGELVLVAAVLAIVFLWIGARPSDQKVVLGAIGLAALATAVFWLYLEPRVGLP